MNAREVAERIADLAEKERHNLGYRGRIAEAVAQAIAQARAEALEAAAKVAETFGPPNPRGAEIAAAIRALGGGDG